MTDKTFTNDIAISSRIRLARNIENTLFPQMASEADLTKVENAVTEALRSEKLAGEKYRFYEIRNMTETQRTSLAESRLISSELGKYDHSGAIINDSNSVSVMINEEDHIRIQSVKPGFDLFAAYRVADRIDDIIGESVNYAFSEKYGYLTSCPTNLGTGMRAGVMVHIPAIVMKNSLAGIISVAQSSGLEIRGAYGEGTAAMGDLFQISNRVSLGKSEIEIVQSIHEFTKEIIKTERAARNELLLLQEDDIKNEVQRAYGILTNAHMISTEEAMKLLSLLRLGTDVRLIENVSPKVVDKLMTEIQPATLTLRYRIRTDARSRDLLRAQHIKTALGDL
ncbi:MAG: protein arginine kinase [Eubacteriaceae bacterium]|nr:protein arginine kinase [Eubacteriaceae bacterium]